MVAKRSQKRVSNLFKKMSIQFVNVIVLDTHPYEDDRISGIFGT